MVVGDDDADDEIVIKMPAVDKDEEGSSSEKEVEEEEDDDDEEGDSESEEPSGEEAEWPSSPFYHGPGTLVVRVKTQTWESHGHSAVFWNQCVSGNYIPYEKHDSALIVGVTVMSLVDSAHSIMTVQSTWAWFLADLLHGQNKVLTQAVCLAPKTEIVSYPHLSKCLNF